MKLFLLDQYDDAELDRKKVAAMHALFITTPAPAEPLDAAEGRDENDERTLDLQPGQRGYDAEQVDAEIAADKARERELGLAFGSHAASAPTGETSQASYEGTAD